MRRKTVNVANHIKHNVTRYWVDVKAKPGTVLDVIREGTRVREVGGDVPSVLWPQGEDVILEFGSGIIVICTSE
jgi:hypothetical protein